MWSDFWIQGGASALDKMQGVRWDTGRCSGGVLHAEVNSWRISHHWRHSHLSNSSWVISSSFILLLMVTFSFLHLQLLLSNFTLPLFTVCGPNSSHCNLPFLFSKKNNLPAIFGVTLRWRVFFYFIFYFLFFIFFL